MQILVVVVDGRVSLLNRNLSLVLGLGLKEIEAIIILVGLSFIVLKCSSTFSPDRGLEGL